MRRVMKNFGSALKFNGVDTVVTCGNAASTENTQNKTFNVWVKINSLAAGGDVFGRQYDDIAGNDAGFRLRYNSSSNKKFNFSVADSTGNFQTVVSNLVPNYEKWYMVTCVQDIGKNQLRLYINGELDNTATCIGYRGFTFPSSYQTSTAFMIGRYSVTGTAFFNGIIDELRIWNKVLTEYEIQQLFESNVVPQEASQTGAYLFDEGSGTTIDDSVGTNNGTITNAVFVTDVAGEPRTAAP